ncbi:hypothetical protein ACRAWG_15150 [Methylobacterium sp. P31]
MSLWNEARTEGQEIETMEERHESRPAAIEAARRLLAEHAHRFDKHVTVEADVISELEWVPMKAQRSGDEAGGFG